VRPATLVRLRLATLAAAAFVYVTSETFPVAVLPQLGAGLGVGDAAVGRLVTLYAVVVAVTAVPLVVLTGRVPRRGLVTATVAALCVSNLLVAIAPGYGTVLAGRLVGALGHGMFWSVLAPVAASLVPPERAGRATAAAFLGNSVALVAGTPVTAALGAAIGWRQAAVALAAVAAVCAVTIRAVLPAFPAPPPGPRVLASLASALRNRSLRGVSATTLVIVVGHFAAYTYIALLVRRDLGVGGTGLSAVLLGYGAAGVLAIAAVGRVLDARPRATTLWCVAVGAGSLLALGLVGSASPAAGVAALLGWGGAFTALPVCLQTAVLRVAGTEADLASAVYVVAFQIGIAAGAGIGGVFVDAGGVGVVPFAAAAAIAVGGLAIRSGRRAFPARGIGTG
jgi:predicted MFS family arabinose efflux permease